MMGWEIGIFAVLTAIVAWELKFLIAAKPPEGEMELVRYHLNRNERTKAVRIYREFTGCSSEDARRDLDAMS